ncbi:YciI family protein [Jiangella alkaliphila]|uniref:Uncharacterized conserved protein n=1 Tax=Jiangella alkaliphila TaxID=419479 RepID=A0A1H2LAN1_9ACTN|nr:YciI family protein [Jiangella alkaliphila]SDU77641.1 Uncharacterized conserved protein [Jiangella alkaliphila]
MRFVSFVRSEEPNPAGQPPPELFDAVAELAHEMSVSGVLVEMGGLLPSSAGALVSLVDGRISAVDGPFTEAKELIGGFAILDVRSREEAVELARRLLRVHQRHWPAWQGTCELRQLEDDDHPHPGLPRP